MAVLTKGNDKDDDNNNRVFVLTLLLNHNKGIVYYYANNNDTTNCLILQVLSSCIEDNINSGTISNHKHINDSINDKEVIHKEEEMRLITLIGKHLSLIHI